MCDYILRIVKLKGSNVLPIGSLCVDSVNVADILQRMDKGDVVSIERVTDKIWRDRGVL